MGVQKMQREVVGKHKEGSKWKMEWKMGMCCGRIPLLKIHPNIIIVIDNIYLFIIELMIITLIGLNYIWKLTYEWQDLEKR